MSNEVRRIVAGVDGSPHGERALEWAIDLAVALHAEVIAVHAVGLLAQVGAGPRVPSQGHLDELRHLFETEWCRPLEATGIASRRLLVDGAPAEAILRAMQDVDADLVVVGRRGSGGLPELLLGSTSHQLAAHAHRPVLVVPPR